MKKFIFSFGYAFRGFYNTLKYERNMRIHFVCMVYMYSFLLIYDFFEVSKTQFAIIFLANALVMATEMINTAIERTVDLVSNKHTQNGKLAKDAAAGGVLISAIFSVATGIAILYQPEAFTLLFTYYKENPVMIFVFVLSILISLMFIFNGFSFKTNTKHNSK